jgi:hypothetical protein
MSEKQMTLAYTLDESEVAITVVRATARIGMARYILANKGFKENEAEPDEALKLLRVMVYPDLVAATTEVTGMKYPLEFEEFIELPEDLINQWADAVYEVNPHWKAELRNAASPLPSKNSETSPEGSSDTAPSPQTKSSPKSP